MNCPYCEAVMEKGKSSFSSLNRRAHMILSYTSDEEAAKSFLKRKSKDKIILDGEEAETYYCSSCKKIITVFDE